MDGRSWAPVRTDYTITTVSSLHIVPHTRGGYFFQVTPQTPDAIQMLTTDTPRHLVWLLDLRYDPGGFTSAVTNGQDLRHGSPILYADQAYQNCFCTGSLTIYAGRERVVGMVNGPKEKASFSSPRGTCLVGGSPGYVLGRWIPGVCAWKVDPNEVYE